MLPSNGPCFETLVLCSGVEKKDPKDSKSKSPSGLKKGKPNVVMFVGLQGSGKTTTCMKYALTAHSHYP